MEFKGYKIPFDNLLMNGLATAFDFKASHHQLFVFLTAFLAFTALSGQLTLSKRGHSLGHFIQKKTGWEERVSLVWLSWDTTNGLVLSFISCHFPSSTKRSSCSTSSFWSIFAFPLPLINALSNEEKRLFLQLGTLKVFSLCFAFLGSAFTVEGGIGVYLNKNFPRAGILFFIYVAMFRSVVDVRFQTRRNGIGGQGNEFTRTSFSFRGLSGRRDHGRLIYSQYRSRYSQKCLAQWIGENISGGQRVSCRQVRS